MEYVNVSYRSDRHCKCNTSLSRIRSERFVDLTTSLLRLRIRSLSVVRVIRNSGVSGLWSLFTQYVTVTYSAAHWLRMELSKIISGVQPRMAIVSIGVNHHRAAN